MEDPVEVFEQNHLGDGPCILRLDGSFPHGRILTTLRDKHKITRASCFSTAGMVECGRF
jgi:hypothetical protein